MAVTSKLLQMFVYIFLSLVLHTSSFPHNFTHASETQPQYDPRLVEFIWFSSLNLPTESNKKNIYIDITSGSDRTLVDEKKEKKKVPTVPRIVFRLKSDMRKVQSLPRSRFIGI